VYFGREPVPLASQRTLSPKKNTDWDSLKVTVNSTPQEFASPTAVFFIRYCRSHRLLRVQLTNLRRHQFIILSLKHWWTESCATQLFQFVELFRVLDWCLVDGRQFVCSTSSKREFDSRKRSKMDSVVRAVIEAIHSTPTRVVLCLSGGAAQVCFAKHSSICSCALGLKCFRSNKIVILPRLLVQFLAFVWVHYVAVGLLLLFPSRIQAHAANWITLSSFRASFLVIEWFQGPCKS
jgi:hypothetical protein